MILEQLDTFIAFAVVMLLLSVMVMAFVQLVVSMLGLRGRNLRWGVKLLLKEAIPETFNENGGLDAEKIAHEMLTHPALGPTRNWAAMLLRWILEKLRVLKALGEPSAGDGRWRKGIRQVLDTIGVFKNGRRPTTTLRLEEVVKVLQRIQREAPTGSEEATQLTAALAADTQEAETFVTEGKKLAEQLRQQFPEQAKIFDQQIETIGKSGKQLAARVEDWFDTVMDATSERFKLRTRWLTAASALVLAFGFQVDSVSIFRELSGDSDLREALVAKASQSQDMFEELQGLVAEEAKAVAVKADEKATAAEKMASEAGEKAKAAPTDAKATKEAEEAKAVAEEARKAAEEAKAREAAAGPKTNAAAAGAGGGASPGSARHRVDATKASLEKARELVEATGLDILQPLYPTWDEFRADLSRMLPGGQSPDALLEKLGDGLSGKLMTVLLLSLGAPFWYSALSKMTGLRSVVATKLEKKPAGS